MTREEFIMPWMLLVCQPWGRRYDLATREGQVQSDFYFARFKDLDGDTWSKVCEAFAEGDHWPSINELRPMVQNLRPKLRQVTDQRRPASMPPEVREFLSRLTGKMKDMPGLQRGRGEAKEHDA